MATAVSAEPAHGWKRLDGVDLLRSLAIFFVLMNHVNMRLLIAKVPYTKGLPALLVSSLVWNGQPGVQIFFAVSGFLITSTALRRWGALSQVSVPRFYLLRFARIAPLLLLLLAILSVLHFAQLKYFVVPAKTGGLGRALVAALTFHVNVLEARRGYLPANWDILWSLSVEEMFYLFFPLLCRLLRQGRGLVLLLSVFVVLGPFGRTILAQHNPVWHEYSYLGGMDAIAMGCLTAMLMERRDLPGRSCRIVAACGIILTAFGLFYATHTTRFGLDRSGLDMSILAFGTCLVIAAASQSRWSSPHRLAPFLHLGQHSYEIYLTHMFVVFAFFSLFLALGKPLWAVPVFFLAVIFVASAVGGLVARYYSEPMNAWLRRRWS